VRPLVYRELSGAVVWIEAGQGWRHDGTGWTPLRDAAVAMSGWVVCAAELAVVLAGRGRPQ